MNAIVMSIVGALVAFVIMAALMPTILGTFHGTNTTGWTTSEIAVFAVFGILFVVGLLIMIVKLFLKK